jgi:hypothetical protein
MLTDEQPGSAQLEILRAMSGQDRLVSKVRRIFTQARS